MRTKAKPPIDSSTRVGDLMICTTAVSGTDAFGRQSSVRPIRVGLVVHKNDARVIAVPRAFRPLIEQLDLGTVVP